MAKLLTLHGQVINSTAYIYIYIYISLQERDTARLRLDTHNVQIAQQISDGKRTPRLVCRSSRVGSFIAQNWAEKATRSGLEAVCITKRAPALSGELDGLADAKSRPNGQSPWTWILWARRNNEGVGLGPAKSKWSCQRWCFAACQLCYYVQVLRSHFIRFWYAERNIFKWWRWEALDPWASSGRWRAWKQNYKGALR